MAHSPLRSYVLTALDPGVLATPFAVQTRWHVITGAACSGKTTLLTLLAGLGFRTTQEVGRACFESELAKGRMHEEILADSATFERVVADAQLSLERDLPPGETVFLDRGSPDTLTYCRVMGADPNPVLAHCFHYRYASVFMLDRFPVQNDGVRFEDDANLEFEDEWLVQDYRALRYEVVRVPALPPEDRVALVLESLAARGLL